MSAIRTFFYNLGGDRSRSLLDSASLGLGRIVKFWPAFALVLTVLILPEGSTLLSPAASSGAVPTMEIVAVEKDKSVRIRTANFPASKTFTVTMGPMGTRGIGGYVAGTISSGSGGSFAASFDIPAALHGSRQISIRLQSSGAFPYYSYNWFYNNTTGGQSGQGGVTPTPPTSSAPGYAGIPTFKIVAVQRDQSATIETNNFPANQSFSVTMGKMGTKGINGIVVGTLDSGSGGTLTASYDIPAELRGLRQISIRAQTSHANPYYSYNWFYNSDANVGSVGTGSAAPSSTSTTSTSSPTNTSPTASYSGIPTIVITGVKADESVTFQTHNYPANQNFNVYMGPMGTRGVDGVWVGQFNSGSGGSFPVMVPIAAEMKGARQIAINAHTSHGYPYYSYNWFYNTSTP